MAHHGDMSEPANDTHEPTPPSNADEIMVNVSLPRDLALALLTFAARGLVMPPGVDLPPDMQRRLDKRRRAVAILAAAAGYDLAQTTHEAGPPARPVLTSIPGGRADEPDPMAG